MIGKNINKKKITFYSYAVLQVIFLEFLRRKYLLTIYQTVHIYLLIAIIGSILIFITDKKKESIISWKPIRDIYLIAWSSFHGIIVLSLLTKGGYYLTFSQDNNIQILNIFLGFTIYWICYMITGKCVTAIGISNLVIGIIGVVNHYLIEFRGAPFQVSDIKAARTAVNVMKSYNFVPDIFILIAVADLVLWYILIRHLYGQQEIKRRWNIYNLIVTICVATSCIVLPFTHFEETYARIGAFPRDNYLVDLLVDILNNAVSLPSDYSMIEVQEIITLWEHENQQDHQDVKPTVGEVPNIVVIMNESFSDLHIFGEFTTDVPALEYWDSIQDEVVHGWANVSVLGGNTANSEYEFLSSDSTGVYSGNSRVPYNTYFSSYEVFPSLVSVLKRQGYVTTAFHPYLASGWNRTQVYRAMQFDHIIFLDGLNEEMETMRTYVSDKADYSYIIKWFDNKEKGIPQFFFNVTMQNHGGYTYIGDDFKSTVHLSDEATGIFPQAEQFLSLMKASDEALEDLLSYFREYPEPVIVMMFGDHQPNLEEEFYDYVTGETMNSWNFEQWINQFKTPFIIWSNKGIETKDLGDVSLNYLAPILLEYAGLEMSGFQQYVLKQFDTLPVISSVGVMDNEGNIFAKGSDEFQMLTREYRLLIYNHTVDASGRVDEFFY